MLFLRHVLGLLEETRTYLIIERVFTWPRKPLHKILVSSTLTEKMTKKTDESFALRLRPPTLAKNAVVGNRTHRPPTLWTNTQQPLRSLVSVTFCLIYLMSTRLLILICLVHKKNASTVLRGSVRVQLKNTVLNRFLGTILRSYFTNF